jgi:hypothetical protein
MLHTYPNYDGSKLLLTKLFERSFLDRYFDRANRVRRSYTGRDRFEQIPE